MRAPELCLSLPHHHPGKGTERVISQNTRELPSRQRVEMVHPAVTRQAWPCRRKTSGTPKYQGGSQALRSLLRQETEGRKTKTHPPGRPDEALCVRVRSPGEAELPSRGTKAVSQWGSGPMNETRAGGPPGTTAGWRTCMASVRALMRSLRAGETRGTGAEHSSHPRPPAA